MRMSRALSDTGIDVSSNDEMGIINDMQAFVNIVKSLVRVFLLKPLSRTAHKDTSFYYSLILVDVPMGPLMGDPECFLLILINGNILCHYI